MAQTYQDFADSFVGKGMGLKVFNTTTHKSVVASGEAKINDSIYLILSTKVGERVFLPEFGSKLHKAIFEPNDLIAADLIKLYIEEALQRWEKRIVVQNIEIGDEGEDNIVPVAIYYTWTNSNVSGCYVYPFNLKSDGTEDSYELGTYSE